MIVEQISQPDDGVFRTLSQLESDLLLLGAGGKIGHALAVMAHRALEHIGSPHGVVAVSRFSDPDARRDFEDDGVVTVACDLADPQAVANLPDASHLVFLAGQKFGATGGQAATWMLNTYVPGVVARRWPNARMAVFSSGNVYPFIPPESGGADEATEPDPIGEYAQSVLGRERVFEYFSRANGTPVVTLRLNYAQEPRYGIIVDLAQEILAGRPIDLTTGHVNLLWAGDCNRWTLRSFDLADSPPAILNLAGPQIAVRDLAVKIGKALEQEVQFTGHEAPTALLSNAQRCWQTFGPPTVDIDEMIDRICGHIKAGDTTWNKPTRFQTRDGKF